MGIGAFKDVDILRMNRAVNYAMDETRGAALSSETEQRYVFNYRTHDFLSVVLSLHLKDTSVFLPHHRSPACQAFIIITGRHCEK